MNFKMICVHDVVSGNQSKKNVIKYCKENSPIAPCYNEIVFADGSFYKLTDGKSNNAGHINKKRYKRAMKGKKALSYKPKGYDDFYSNSTIYGIAVAPSCKIMYKSDGKINRKHPAYITLLNRCHQKIEEFGILPEQVWGHSDLTSRKIDPYKPVTPNKLIFRLVRDLNGRRKFRKSKRIVKKKIKQDVWRTNRGLRNRNPGNLRKSNKFTWNGEVGVDDKYFCKFSSDFYGIRALAKDLKSKRRRGLTTLDKIIPVYAPPNENNTEMYIHKVSVWSKTKPDQKIQDKDMVRIVKAFIRMETGYRGYKTSLIKKAVNAK